MVYRFLFFASGVFGSLEPVNLLQSSVEVDSHGQILQVDDDLFDGANDTLALFEGNDEVDKLKDELAVTTRDAESLRANCVAKLRQANSAGQEYNRLKFRYQILQNRYKSKFGLLQNSEEVSENELEEEQMPSELNSTTGGLVPVGQGDGCPAPTHPWGKSTCCCGAGCCWDRCTWPIAPTDNCLVGQAAHATWKKSPDHDYFVAIPTIQDEAPVAQGSGCPSPTHPWGKATCCCGSACCWDRCTWKNPPTDKCLVGQAKGARWKWSSSKGYYVAAADDAGVINELKAKLATQQNNFKRLKTICDARTAKADEMIAKFEDLKVAYADLEAAYKAESA